MANTWERDPWTGCELWTGSLNSNGYGTHWDKEGRPRLAHYVAWESANGRVPAGKVLDHQCRRRTCRAVAHLEVVSQSENTRRQRWSHRATRAKCSKGHDLWKHGRRTDAGGTICRACSGV